MTWDQDQVDSFIKIFNWTNFEKKICCLNTSTAVVILKKGGAQTPNFGVKVSPIGAFYERINLVLVPGHLG